MVRSTQKHERGFTLIELLVVIAIIGLLSAIVLAALSTARANSRNAARLSDINQYVKAAEIYFDQYGYYPTPTDNSWVCLGNYPDGTCWGSTDANSTVNSAFRTEVAKVMPGLPQQGSVRGVEGYIYRCLRDDRNPKALTGTCEYFEVRWFLEGPNKSCGLGKTGTLTQYSDATYCQYCHPSGNPFGGAQASTCS